MAAIAHPRVAAIVVAGGAGTRLGADRPKAFVQVAGRTLLEHAAAAMAAAGAQVIAVVPVGWPDEAERLLPDAVVVAGGASRQASVAAGLAVVDNHIDVVLVHDAARAFVPVEAVRRVVDAIGSGADAVVPVVAVADSIRSVDADVSHPVHRDGLRAVQTPQGFTLAALRAAHAVAGDSATDDATLAEEAGYPVHLVDGDPRAFKVTTALDLLLARAMMDR